MTDAENFQFQIDLRELASAFDKKVVTEQLVNEYWKAFRSLTLGQWQDLCRWSKLQMETFPRISNLKRRAFELKFYERNDDRPEPWIAVECECGRDFVVPSRFQANTGFPCECGKVYPHGEIIRDAVRGVLRRPEPERATANIHDLLTKLKAEIPKGDALPF